MCKKYYNTVDYNKIFLYGVPTNYRCLLKIDADNVNVLHIQEFIENLKSIIEHYEFGQYDYNGISINIVDKFKISNEHIVTKNPKLDDTLLRIE
jgi:hypothetical protein